MKKQTPALIVTCGSIPESALSPTLPEIVKSFGWDYLSVAECSQMRLLSSHDDVVAVLLCPEVLGLLWNEALESVRDACPQALPIFGLTFSNAAEWPEMAAAGVFHSFMIPTVATELRQSLGFAWKARRRAAMEGSGKKRGRESMIYQPIAEGAPHYVIS